MNLCSLSKSQGAAALACLLAVVALASSLTGDRATATPAMLVAIVLLLGYTIWAQRRALNVVDEAAEVCRKAASGNLEARMLGDRQPDRLGTIQKSVNDMLDVSRLVSGRAAGEPPLQSELDLLPGWMRA